MRGLWQRFRAAGKKTVARRSRSSYLNVEHLEDRRVLSTMPLAHLTAVPPTPTSASTSAPTPTPTSTLQAQGTIINATAGQSFTALVATFTDSATNTGAGEFTATIDWGDGTTSTGTITANTSGGFDVNGTHTYTTEREGEGEGEGQGQGDDQGQDEDQDFHIGRTEESESQPFIITVTIQDTTTNDTATAFSLATVSPASPKIIAQGLNIQATAGQPFSGAVATFTDVIPGAVLGDFTATIDWGDGTTSAGTITANADGSFTVSGTHTYTLDNDLGGSSDDTPSDFGDPHFRLSVTITDTKTQDQATTESVATVTPTAPAIAVTTRNIQATSGKSFTAVVATFTDVTAGATPANFTATIDWGDGTTSMGTITVDPMGGFDVTGTHTYTIDNDPSHDFSGSPGLGSGEDDDENGSEIFRFKVTVQNTTTGDVGSNVGEATVSPAPSSVKASGTTIQAVAGQSFTATVATFTTTDTNPMASNFTATIDWGDGTTSTGTIVADPMGGFDVTGTHTYTTESEGEGEGEGEGQGQGEVQGQGEGHGQDEDQDFHIGPTEESESQPFIITVTIQDTTTHDTATAFSLATVSPTAKVTDTAMLTPVGEDFLQSSEFLSSLVTQDYQQLLGRTPDSVGLAYWVGAMQQGLSVNQVSADILSSSEFNSRAGHSPQAWVNAVYQNFLSRSPDAAGQAYWLKTLGSGASENAIALAFANSPEHEALVVQSNYQKYLGRTGSTAEVSYWVNSFESGVSNTQIAAGFLGSQEYYLKQNDNPTTWLASVYQAVLSRPADAAGDNYWLSVLQE
jgi:hypothetical protein